MKIQVIQHVLQVKKLRLLSGKEGEQITCTDSEQKTQHRQLCGAQGSVFAPTKEKKNQNPLVPAL